MRLYLRALCNQTPPRSFLLALCLLIPLALLAASCSSNSDSTAPEDPDPQDPVTTEIAGENSSDSTPPEVSPPRSTTSTQSEHSSGNTAENSNSGALPATNQQSQINQSKATAISAGDYHACALHQTGSISCWGGNGDGQLGDGTGGNEGDMSLVPVKVQGIDDATSVSAGNSHSCALHQTGTISCWGSNWEGQLGNGTGGNYGDMSSVPVKVQGIDDATSVSAGNSHSCALHQTGTISCWGSNWEGQLGNGTGGNYGDMSSVPVKVQGIDDATSVSAGNSHSCALHQTGTISCWGGGWTGASLVPVEVQGIDDATAITAWAQSCALHQNGTISCWGNNLTTPPDFNEEPTTVPVKVVNIDDATAISTGWGHSCALHQNGTISCWGDNSAGELGSKAGELESSGNAFRFDTFGSSVPVGVTDISNATAITAGRGYSCALHQTGSISCWGNDDYGQLGDGTNNYSSVPVKVQGIDDAAAISAGAWSSCALHNDGNISCWGDNGEGQLGNGTGGTFHDHSPVPVKVMGIDDATAITTGSFVDSHSCALHQTGTISCWGNNNYGQLGNGTGGNEGDMSLVPVEVQGIDDATAITALAQSCALHQNGTISCWGNNLTTPPDFLTIPPDFNEEPTTVPVKVVNIDDATAISTGWGHSCALHQNGTISCWGDNTFGQLGDGTGNDLAEYSSVPVKVVNIDDATAISTDWTHSCALHQNGTISCWGNNEDGQLGDGTGGNEGDYSSVPVKVVNIDDATAISTDWGHSCALHQNGTISCWGRNLTAQLDDNEEPTSSVPVKVQGIEEATAITAGSGYSCALHQTGNISCWGSNYRGALGDGTYISSFVPRFVVGFGG